ncbi:tyrosine-type recombinase/integrase [Nocardia sp. NPDC056611]|uniref:tyrosine-type recombinase/integrase n=1 Tax=Nocardia sp. NPDC056611 TaxID=3345877 RepID=UPI0036708593
MLTHINDARGRAGRTHPEASERELRVALMDARLFVGPRGGRIATGVLRDATHRDDVVARLGFEHLHRHDLRHTGLTWFADAGVPLHRLQQIAGHTDPRITQRYLHPDVKALQDDGELPARFLALPNGGLQIPDLLARRGSDYPRASPSGPKSVGRRITENPFRPRSEGIFLVGLTGFEPATT